MSFIKSALYSQIQLLAKTDTDAAYLQISEGIAKTMFRGVFRILKEKIRFPDS